MNTINTIVIGIVLLLHVVKLVKPENEVVTIREFRNNNYEDGSYSFRFTQSDDSEREESGGFLEEGKYFVKGFYSYVDPSGKKQYVEYYADSTGYHPRIEEHTPQIPQRRPPTNRIAAAAVATLLG